MVLSRPPTPNLTASGTTSATLRFLPKDLRRAGGVAGVEAHVGRELKPRLCYDTYALSEAHTEGVTSDFLMAAWLSSEIRCSFRARLCWLWMDDARAVVAVFGGVNAAVLAALLLSFALPCSYTMYEHEWTVGAIISGFEHNPRRLISDRVRARY